jgi:tetratricopeptide (TPR) repeat protein
VHAATPLAQVTTSSFEALRKYSAGARAITAGDYLRGRTLLQEAISLDTTFAMAYRLLAGFLADASFLRHEQAELSQKAYDHRSRVGALEQLQIEGAYWRHGPTVDHARSIAAYEAVLDLDPENVPALASIAGLTNELRQFDRSLAFARRALAADSAEIVMHYLIAAAHAEFGSLDSALAAAQRMAATGVPHPLTPMLLSELALAAGDAARAERYGGELERAGNDVAREWGLFIRSSLALRAGRLRASELTDSLALELMRARGVPDAAIGIGLGRAERAIRLRHDTATALRLLDAAVAGGAVEAIPARDRPYLMLSVLNARAGRVDRARQYADALERTFPTRTVPALGWLALPHARAEIAIAEGRWGESLVEYQRARSVGCTICLLPEIGEAYERSGQSDSAIVVYERYLNSPSVDLALFFRPYHDGPVHARLAALHEAQGNLSGAAQHYAAFVELWKDADPELQPRVRAARARLRALEARLR